MKININKILSMAVLKAVSKMPNFNNTKDTSSGCRVTLSHPKRQIELMESIKR